MHPSRLQSRRKAFCTFVALGSSSSIQYAADLIPPPISAGNQQSRRHQSEQQQWERERAQDEAVYRSDRNVYSINPLVDVASWPGWHSWPPDIPHSIQAAGISWCVLGTGSEAAGLAWPAASASARVPVADYDNGGDLEQKSWLAGCQLLSFMIAGLADPLTF